VRNKLPALMAGEENLHSNGKNHGGAKKPPKKLREPKDREEGSENLLLPTINTIHQRTFSL
jgi:hypothetical protein